LAPDGQSLGVIKMPEQTANFTWGDDDMMSIFLTASTSLYRFRTRTPVSGCFDPNGIASMDDAASGGAACL
jgi:sugar lactone lactonase YvrE